VCEAENTQKVQVKQSSVCKCVKLKKMRKVQMKRQKCECVSMKV